MPDADLVAGSAAARYADHRESDDHDHVLTNLKSRFETVLDALEREPDWVTPGKIILGSLADIEAGVRQLIRQRPLEVETISVGNGGIVRVPTLAEMVRIKVFLVVRRNQVRDYRDVAALSAVMGSAKAATVLTRIDDFYVDTTRDGEVVATQAVRQLGNPQPRDRSVTRELSRYKQFHQTLRFRNVNDDPTASDFADPVERLPVGPHPALVMLRARRVGI